VIKSWDWAGNVVQWQSTLGFFPSATKTKQSKTKGLRINELRICARPVAQVVEHLLSKLKGLISNHSTGRKGRKKGRDAGGERRKKCICNSPSKNSIETDISSATMTIGTAGTTAFIYAELPEFY
jgi:hypothetical protein